MKRFTLVLLTAVLMAGGASAQKVRRAAGYTGMQPAGIASIADAKAAASHGTRQAQRAVSTGNPDLDNLPDPDPEAVLINTTPEGEFKQYVKEGYSYGYHYFLGAYGNPVYGGITNIVISNDKKHVYMQRPVLLFDVADANKTWIVGDLEDDIVTFKFPQVLDEDKTYDENNNVIDVLRDYVMRLEFVPDDPSEPDYGMYIPSENQTYRFRMEADGTLVSLESDDVLLGACNYYEADPEWDIPAMWNWTQYGDMITIMKPFDNKALEVPADVQFEEWQLIADISHRPVNIGVSGDKMYIKGIFADMPDAAVVGSIDGNKVSFEGGQFIGLYEAGGTTAYFVPGNYDSVKPSFEILNSIEFTYDSANKTLESDATYCIASDPEKIVYYELEEKPYMCVPNPDLTVKELLTPLLHSFYPEDADELWGPTINIMIPIVDKDHNILPTESLFWQVIADNEIMVFHNDDYDDYDLPEGVTETDEIPFGYNSPNAIDDFYSNGLMHGCNLHGIGYETLGARVVYRADAEATPVYSPVVWMPGMEGTFNEGGVGVKGVDGAAAKSVEYYNLNGVRVANPTNGIFVKRTVLSDGTVKTSKITVK